MAILEVGSRIGGYEILRPIGRGGMGEIYLARQASIGREVALKVLSPALVARDPTFAEQFIREAQAAGKLSHPNIIAVHDVGAAAAGGRTLSYFSMEFIDGENCAAIVNRDGPMPVEKAGPIVASLAAALAYAARTGMVHRDIKPENVMITRDGRVKLADFGLALNVDDAGPAKADQAGRPQVMGSPRYMSPEQARARPLDHRSDQYSLGATLFFLLTGQPPFRRGNARELMHAHVAAPVPDPGELVEVSEGWAGLCQRLMAKDPADRFADPEDLVRTISALVDGKPVRVRPRTGLRSTTSKPPVALVAVAVAVLAAAGLGAWLILRPARPVSTTVTGGMDPQAGAERAAALAAADAFLAGLPADPAAALAELRGPKGLGHAYFMASPAALARLQEREKALGAALGKAADDRAKTLIADLDALKARVAAGAFTEALTRVEAVDTTTVPDAQRAAVVQRLRDLRALVDRGRADLVKATRERIAGAADPAALDAVAAGLAALDLPEAQRTALAGEAAKRRAQFAALAAEAERTRLAALRRDWPSIANALMACRNDGRSFARQAKAYADRADAIPEAADLGAIARELAAVPGRAEAFAAGLNDRLAQKPVSVPFRQGGRDLTAELGGFSVTGRFKATYRDTGVTGAIEMTHEGLDLPRLVTAVAGGDADLLRDGAAFAWINGLAGADDLLLAQPDAPQTRAIVALLRPAGRLLQRKAGAARSGDVWDFATAPAEVVGLFTGEGASLADGALRWACDRPVAPQAGEGGRLGLDEAKVPTLTYAQAIGEGSRIAVDLTVEAGSLALIGLVRDGRAVRLGLDTRQPGQGLMAVVSTDAQGRLLCERPRREALACAPLRLVITWESGAVGFALGAAGSAGVDPVTAGEPAQPGAWRLAGDGPAFLVVQSLNRQGRCAVALRRLELARSGAR